MFGQCCFDAGDVNCTMGTGSFIDINTGSYPHASVAGKTETSADITLAQRSNTSHSTMPIFLKKKRIQERDIVAYTHKVLTIFQLF